MTLDILELYTWAAVTWIFPVMLVHIDESARTPRVGSQPGRSQNKGVVQRLARGFRHRWDHVLPCDSIQAGRNQLFEACFWTGSLKNSAGFFQPSMLLDLVPPFYSHFGGMARSFVLHQWMDVISKRNIFLLPQDWKVKEFLNSSFGSYVNTAPPHSLHWMCSATKHVWNYQAML